MATQREIHITSNTIHRTCTRIDRELKTDMIGFVRGLIPAATVGGKGFGTLGNHIIGDTYKSVQHRFDALMGQAMATLDSWEVALTNCERNWKAAEDASMVRYRA
ncbi:hypothetical protein [Nonomuraea sp. NPDC050786]|uniref:hypothetical protein n=1 Tax=Nonomuraea sp. NPDC050786 TaxID=3154840 RepID=UPI0033E4EA96